MHHLSAQISFYFNIKTWRYCLLKKNVIINLFFFWATPGGTQSLLLAQEFLLVGSGKPTEVLGIHHGRPFASKCPTHYLWPLCHLDNSVTWLHKLFGCGDTILGFGTLQELHSQMSVCANSTCDACWGGPPLGVALGHTWLGCAEDLYALLAIVRGLEELFLDCGAAGTMLSACRLVLRLEHEASILWD